MPSSLSRGPLTTRLITELKTANFPVGDNSKPDVPHGWQGEPNGASSTFIPWLTLTPLAAQPQSITGALGDTGTEWRLGYSVYYAGLSRKMTEALADRMRSNLINIARENYTSETGTWRIQKVSCTAVGSSQRIGSAYPDYFTQADTFDVWISKEQ